MISREELLPELGNILNSLLTKYNINNKENIVDKYLTNELYIKLKHVTEYTDSEIKLLKESLKKDLCYLLIDNSSDISIINIKEDIDNDNLYNKILGLYRSLYDYRFDFGFNIKGQFDLTIYKERDKKYLFLTPETTSDFIKEILCDLSDDEFKDNKRDKYPITIIGNDKEEQLYLSINDRLKLLKDMIDAIFEEYNYIDKEDINIEEKQYEVDNSNCFSNDYDYQIEEDCEEMYDEHYNEEDDNGFCSI